MVDWTVLTGIICTPPIGIDCAYFDTGSLLFALRFEWIVLED